MASHLLLPRKPRKKLLKATAMLDKQAHCASMEADLEAHLKSSFPTNPPLVVTEPMRHLVSCTPKSMAPVLCLAACELVGGRRDRAMDAACAIQLMHAAKCVHGRLIGLDSSPLTYSPAIELLTGDGVFPLGFEIIARNRELDPEIGVRVVMEMTEALGGMVEGQLGRVEGGMEEEWVWERTEGRLCACAAACGALVGGGGEEVVESVRRCGMYVGMMRGSVGLERAENLRSRALELLEAFHEEQRAAMLSLMDMCFHYGFAS
ncbi:hypothetical protein J5N97_029988 [Dioscorea zingiberensis]|uniref:Uncharacterized protein n=1 Tax=Dioscorea zingiberensis TaxID=325984 RepID=A0A9D5H3L6_9LILI|nr:hypothetical protein J5N97_029988 [Dioscorea zingiberensis]